MLHIYGDKPTRPLQVGDQIKHPAVNKVRTVTVAGTSILYMADGGWVFRRPAEGDFSQVVMGVPAPRKAQP